MLNEIQVATAASKRLKMDGRDMLTLQSLIPSALNMLARHCADDRTKRRLLITDRDTTTATISGTDPYSADLSTLQTTPQIMLDYLQFGTVFWYPPTITFPHTDVNTIDDVVEIQGTTASTYLTEGTVVRISNPGTLPTNLFANVDYYITSGVDAPDFAFSETAALATAGTKINLAGQGSGTNTLTIQQRPVAQWLATPNIADLDACVNYSFPYIWLIGNELFTNKTAGTFKFSVPFIPTLTDFTTYSSVNQLTNDLIDCVVSLAIDSGYEAKDESTK